MVKSYSVKQKKETECVQPSGYKQAKNGRLMFFFTVLLLYMCSSDYGPSVHVLNVVVVGGLVFLCFGVSQSNVWGLVFLRLGVSQCYVRGLVFLRLEVSFLTFRG